MEEDKLYLTKASRYVEADPVRGIDNPDIKYKGPYVVIAPNPIQAVRRTEDKCNSGFAGDWKAELVKELKIFDGTLTLEARLRILKEAGIEIIS